MAKIERGVMVMKDGEAWGELYPSGHGHGSSYGWMSPEDAPIHNPQYCKKPTDVTYRNSPYIEELEKGMLVSVERITTVKIVDV